MNLARLAARVDATNRANTVAKELYTKFRAALEPFLGKQVLKVDGSLLQKVERAVGPLPSGNDLMVYHHRTGYSLAWVVKTSEPDGPHSVVYHEVVVYVGGLQGTTLEKFGNPPDYLRTDYTVAEIVAARKAVEVAKAELDKAREDLASFGEYDR